VGVWDQVNKNLADSFHVKDESLIIEINIQIDFLTLLFLVHLDLDKLEALSNEFLQAPGAIVYLKLSAFDLKVVEGIIHKEEKKIGWAPCDPEHLKDLRILDLQLHHAQHIDDRV